MSLSVKKQTYDDLTEDEQISVPDNGAGKEYATYLRVIHNGRTLVLENDAMEPEDCSFDRDLDWIRDAILHAYEAGCSDAKGESQ